MEQHGFLFANFEPTTDTLTEALDQFSLIIDYPTAELASWMFPTFLALSAVIWFCRLRNPPKDPYCLEVTVQTAYFHGSRWGRPGLRM